MAHCSAATLRYHRCMVQAAPRGDGDRQAIQATPGQAGGAAPAGATSIAAPAAPAAPLSGPALREHKRALREGVLARVDALGPAARARAARRIVEAIVALPSFRDARTVLLTLSFRNEWQTRPLLEAAGAAGKRVALPRVDATARTLSLCEVRSLARDVAAGFHGIDEPLAHCEPVAPPAVDWVLVPGVAFDAERQRLGYGGGYYDRLLPTLVGATRVAGAFDVQIVDRVPAAPHDQRVDVLVSESRRFGA